MVRAVTVDSVSRASRQLFGPESHGGDLRRFVDTLCHPLNREVALRPSLVGWTEFCSQVSEFCCRTGRSRRELFCAQDARLRLNHFHWYRTVVGIPAFAPVPVKLLLNTCLGFFNFGEGAHWSFELLAARCADRDAWYLPQMLNNSKRTFDYETLSLSPLPVLPLPINLIVAAEHFRKHAATRIE